MSDKFNDAEAIIIVEGRTYALYKNGPLKRYPYIIDIVTGQIPNRQQLPIVKSYLRQYNVQIKENWTTHRYICQAISIAKAKSV